METKVVYLVSIRDKVLMGLKGIPFPNLKPITITTMRTYKSVMKYAATAIGCLMIFTGAATAQTVHQSNPITWGISSGLTISDLWGDDVGGTTVRAGYTGGLFLNYRMSPNFSIQPEAVFTMRYSQVDKGVLGEAAKTDYDLGYLEFPVLFKAHLPNTSVVTPNIYVGPSLAFKLYGEADGDDLKSRHNSVDFGLAFGGGVDIMRTMYLDLRYTLGLVDVFDVPGDPEAKNGTFSITVGYGF